MFKENLESMYCELGLTSLFVERKIELINYWYKLIKADSNSRHTVYLSTRNALTKFRTSSHSLNLETGRYDNTP